MHVPKGFNLPLITPKMIQKLPHSKLSSRTESLKNFPSSRLSRTQQILVAAGGCWSEVDEDDDVQQLLRLPLALPFLSSSSRTEMEDVAARPLTLSRSILTR